MDDELGIAEPDFDGCCARTNRTDQLIGINSFWVEGVGIILVGIPGVVGNLLSICVLTTRNMRNVFHTLLVVLAFVDTLLIGFSILDYSIVRGFDQHFNWYGKAFPYAIYPTTNMVLCASIFLVVAIAYERYTAVCNPYEYRASISTQSTRKRVGKLLIPVAVLTVAINIPKFFETYTVEIPPDQNSTYEGGVTVSYNITQLRMDPSYITIYVHWFLMFVTGVIPISCLVFLNASIYAKILETRRLRERCRIRSSTVIALQNLKHDSNQDLTSHQQQLLEHRSPSIAISNGQITQPFESNSLAQPLPTQSQSQSQGRAQASQGPRHGSMSTKDIKMARVLLSIVMVFFICHLPRISLNLIEFYLSSEVERCGEHFCIPAPFMFAVPYTHLLLVFNSSINIVIYCIVGDGFRAGLRESLKRKGKPSGEKVSFPKTFARLRSRESTKSKDKKSNGMAESLGAGGGKGYLQIPNADMNGLGSRSNSLSIAVFDETMATMSENILTRASSRINVKDVDIDMVQIALKAQANKEPVAFPLSANSPPSPPSPPIPNVKIEVEIPTESQPDEREELLKQDSRTDENLDEKKPTDNSADEESSPNRVETAQDKNSVE